MSRAKGQINIFATDADLQDFVKTWRKRVARPVSRCMCDRGLTAGILNAKSQSKMEVRRQRSAVRSPRRPLVSDLRPLLSRIQTQGTQQFGGSAALFPRIAHFRQIFPFSVSSVCFCSNFLFSLLWKILRVSVSRWLIPRLSLRSVLCGYCQVRNLGDSGVRPSSGAAKVGCC